MPLTCLAPPAHAFANILMKLLLRGNDPILEGATARAACLSLRRVDHDSSHAASDADYKWTALVA